MGTKLTAKLTPLTARHNGPLAGRARVPGDKSTSIRALIFGAMAVGETRIKGLLEGEDVLNTAQTLRDLGASVERKGAGEWRVRGVGVGGFAEPAQKLDFGNSGTGCRLMLGVVGGCPITATFDGDASLRSRPMKRILDPLERIGARTVSSTDGRLPLTLAGARDPIPIEFRPPVPSAQLKSAALLAGLSAPGETVIIMGASGFIGRNLVRLSSYEALETESRKALSYLCQDFGQAQAVKTGTVPTASAASPAIASNWWTSGATPSCACEPCCARTASGRPRESTPGPRRGCDGFTSCVGATTNAG